MVAPLGAAWERMKQVLFRPFDLSRWLAIGFCAWLATLGEAWGGGGGSWGGGGRGGNRGGAEGWEGFAEGLRDFGEEVSSLVLDHLGWVLVLGAAVLAVGACVLLLVLWLSSRGRFMFLHAVATNRAEVVRPWRDHAAHGNGLFWFRLALALGGAVLVLPCFTISGWAAYRMVAWDARSPELIVLAVGLGLAGFGASLGMLVVEKWTADFVVPVMWLRTASWRVAWGEVWRLTRGNPVEMALYLGFYLLLLAACAVVMVAFVLLTCCVGGILLAIPYVGTVLLLPMLVLLRAYSALFLAQFGPEYDVFAAPPGNSSVGGSGSATSP